MEVAYASSNLVDTIVSLAFVGGESNFLDNFFVLEKTNKSHLLEVVDWDLNLNNWNFVGISTRLTISTELYD